MLSEFRHRLVEGKSEQLLPDTMLGHFKAKGLKAGGKGGTDSSRVLAKVRVLTRLGLIGEMLRATLNDVATVVPSWLRSIAEPKWYERYGTRVSDDRLPKREQKRNTYALQVGADGYKLLDGLAELPAAIAHRSAVQVRKAVWQQTFERQEEKLRWLRERQAAAPNEQRSPVTSPYGPEATRSVKRSTHWVGYKIQLSESCDDDMPHVITNVPLSAATEQAVSSTPQVHAQLKQKNLLPDTHLVDAGYVSAALLVDSKADHGVHPFGPHHVPTSWQSKQEGAYDLSCFDLDWDSKKATCPQGKTSKTWREQRDRDRPAVYIRFADQESQSCEAQALCTRSEKSRALMTHPQAHFEAMQPKHEQMQTATWKKQYGKRAGVEGTISQGSRAFALRRCRYIGEAKARWQQIASSAAMNLARVIAWLDGERPQTTRTSPSSQLQHAC